MACWWAGRIIGEAILLDWKCGEVVEAGHLLGVRHILSEAISLHSHCGHLVGHSSLNCVSLVARRLVNLRTLDLVVDHRVLVHLLASQLRINLLTHNF